MPVGIEAMTEGMDVRVTDRLDEALDGCDVAMALRIQLERQESGAAPRIPSLREYHDTYGLRAEHLEEPRDLGKLTHQPLLFDLQPGLGHIRL